MRGSRHLTVPALLVALVLGAGGLAACGGGGRGDRSEAVLYHCPMHPTYVSDTPGDCPICNMKLVPIQAPAGSHAGLDTTAVPAGYSVVKIGDEAVALAGIRTTEAVLDTMGRTVRTVAIMKADETRVHQVNTRVSGWVETLEVNFTGQFVRKGDPLLTIYSPELLASQEEYLNTLAAVRKFRDSDLPEVREGTGALLHSTRSRLLLAGVPESLLERIESTGKPERVVALEAPATGFVSGKEISAGARIEPGLTLFTITDLSLLWLEADVYEYEAPLVRAGTEAVITLPYDPGFRRTARVSYVYPTLDPVTRTIKVRFDIENQDLALRPDMYADVEIRTGTEPGVVIPDDAVLDSGTRRIVFVETAPGTFEPREVTLGMRAEGWARIAAGVAAGERVVVRANFLLDSESRLKAAIGGFTSGSHGKHP